MAESIPYACAVMRNHIYWVMKDWSLLVDGRAGFRISYSFSPPNNIIHKAFPLRSHNYRHEDICGVIRGENQTDFYILGKKNQVLLELGVPILDAAFSINDTKLLILTTKFVSLYTIHITEDGTVEVSPPAELPLPPDVKSPTTGCVTFPYHENPTSFYIGCDEDIWTCDYSTTGCNYLLLDLDLVSEGDASYYFTQIICSRGNQLAVCANRNNNLALVAVKNLVGGGSPWKTLKINTDHPPPNAMTLQTGQDQSKMVFMKYSKGERSLFFLDAYSAFYEWEFGNQKVHVLDFKSDEPELRNHADTYEYIAGDLFYDDNDPCFKGVLMRTSEDIRENGRLVNKRYPVLEYVLKAAEEEEEKARPMKKGVKKRMKGGQ